MFNLKFLMIMKRMRMFIMSLFAILIIATFTQSCATIFSGTKSGVRVSGLPEGANVYYNGNFEGKAPCRVKVSKNSLKNGNTKVQIKQEGFKDAEVTLARKMKIGAFVGDVFVFPVGHIVDFMTGAIYKPYPRKVEYNLQKK